jgi:predicted sulfurtransferase
MNFSKKLILTLLSFWMCLTYSAISQAGQGEYAEITAPEVKQMLVDPMVLIVNTLSNLEHELQHISGSVNIPIDRINEVGRLPANLGTSIIFYCMSPR